MNKRHTTNLIILVVILLILPLNVFCQKYPTRFLGFPVDGPKEVMIQNLKSKGFIYHNEEDYFTGNYFGEPVYIVLKIRDRKVNRVLLYDINERDSIQIRERFNKLYDKYKADNKYVYMEDHDARLSKYENITVGISQYRKNYKVVFGQKRLNASDSINEQKKALSSPEEVKINDRTLKADFNERCRRIHAKALARTISTTDDRYMNQMWFAIFEKFGKYALIQSFDNLYNFTQPSEDDE